VRSRWLLLACVERLAGEESGDLTEGVLPGGAYLRERLRGEPPELYDRIAPGFEALESQMPRDRRRPLLEHYRRHDEVDLLMPV
jgi:DNA gyrase inhibitor GyrI